jgi:hypothetical protein
MMTMKGWARLLGGLLLAGAAALPASADTARTALLKAADTEANGAYTRQRFVEVQRKPFDAADSRRKLLLIGDSHAQDFLNGVAENGYLKGYQIRTRHIPTPCQIALPAPAQAFIEPKDAAVCAAADNLVQAKDQLAEADLVILAARWKEWSAKLLPETIKALALRPEQRVLVLGAKDFGRLSLRHYLKLSDAELLALRNKPDAGVTSVNQLLRERLGGDVFIDPQPVLCGTEGCRLFTDDVQLITYDGGHLTAAGAKYVGKLLFNSTLLGKL